MIVIEKELPSAFSAPGVTSTKFRICNKFPGSTVALVACVLPSLDVIYIVSPAVGKVIPEGILRTKEAEAVNKCEIVKVIVT